MPKQTIKPEKNQIIEYPKEALIPALDRVWRGAWSKDNTRPVLACVLFTAEKKRLTLVSTDGFKLLIVRTELDYTGSDFLLMADHVKKMAGDGKKPLLGSLEVDYIERRVKHNYIEGATLYQMVDDGRFPNWKQVIPTPSTDARTIAFDLKLLKDLAGKNRQVIMLTDGETKPIGVKTPEEKGYKSENYLMPIKIK